MLLLMDELIEGTVRERLIISYLRYKGRNELPLIDDVVKLCKSTGYVRGSGKKAPSGYPANYIGRYPLQEHAISLTLGRLRSDDIYNAQRSYPLPEHRSTALAGQGAMVYTMLYLKPEVLAQENATMREIADKFFPDNWVIAYYLGYTVDLSAAWEPYKAARAAIGNTVEYKNVAAVSRKHWAAVERLRKEVQDLLKEGILTEEYILDNLGKLLNTARACNVALRWVMLHASGACVQRKLRECAESGGGEEYLERIAMFLLNLAQFEFVLKSVVKEIFEAKKTRWEESKREASTRVDELGDFFSDTQALSTRGRANKNLEKWFHDIAREIDTLDVTDSAVASGRKMQQLKQALEEVEQFHELEQSLQVRQFLADVRKYLDQMLRICNVSSSVLGMLDLVSDMGYAWEVIRERATYVALFQAKIKATPTLVIKLRSVLVKLSSILNVPLVRINQAESPDLVSVSAYFSDELVDFTRAVLEVIPRSVFELLSRIIALQTQAIPELPTKVEKDQVRDFACLDERARLAKITYAVSVYTEGILAMQTTLVGVGRVVPRRLLEEGIRKELVYRVASALDTTLTFKTDRLDELHERLCSLARILDGHARSFQYIQDYIRLQGLRVWQEEFMRIVNFNVEQECAAFLTRRAQLESRFQSREVAIPVFPPRDSASVNFAGRLARALLVHTDFRNTVYVPDMAAWYEASNSAGRLLIGPSSFEALQHGISEFGMSGLDQLYCFMIVSEIRRLLRFLQISVFGDLRQAQTQLYTKKQRGGSTGINIAEMELPPSQLFKSLMVTLADLTPQSSVPREAAKLYENALKLVKPVAQQFLDAVCSIGQMQLVRQQIAALLNITCKTDAGVLYGALDVFNRSLLKDIQAHYIDPSLPYPDVESPLLPELAKYLEMAGLSEPLAKIYSTTKPSELLPLFTFLVLTSVTPRYTYNDMLAVLICKKDKHRADSTPLIMGIVTLLKQFHSSYSTQFLALCGQYIRSQFNTIGISQKLEVPKDVSTLAYFVELYAKYGSVPQRVLECKSNNIYIYIII